MKRALFIACWKPQWIQMAEIAIRTFRAHNPEIHIDLMCDSSLAPLVTADVQVWTCPDCRSLQDVFMRKLIFFHFVHLKDDDKVMYVDSDIVTKKPCGHYFDVEFGAFQEATTKSIWHSLPGFFEEELPAFNSGLMVFRAGAARSHYSRAAELYLQNLGATGEQAILNNVLLKNETIHFFDADDILTFATYAEIEKAEGKIFIHLSGLGQSVETKLKFMSLYEHAA